jgi:hypothetical protein
MLRQVLSFCLCAVLVLQAQTPTGAAELGGIDPQRAAEMAQSKRDIDPVVDIWSGEGGGYRWRSAIVPNPNRHNDGFDFVGVFLTPLPVFDAGEAHLFLKRTDHVGIYSGREKWKAADRPQQPLWRPVTFVISSDGTATQKNLIDFQTPYGDQWVLARGEAPTHSPATLPMPASTDATSTVPTSRPPSLPSGPMVLEDGTPVKLRTGRTISSAEARVGDTLDLEVLEEVRINDVVVIPQGGLAWATVTEAEHKKRMGRGGKLNVNIDAVKLVNGQRAPLRAVQGGSGGGHVGAMTGAIVATAIVFWPAAPLFLFMHGKDITVPKGTAVTAYINGNVPIDKASLMPKGETPIVTAVSAAAAKETVNISSVPSNADIELDGAFVGNTPSSLTLEPGDHLIVVTHKGFKKWERKLRTSSGTVNLTAEMEPEATPK